MLVGKGSVGGQMLTCLPHLERLRARFGDALAVWPFDGPADPGSAIVLAETWHALFGWRAMPGSCRDEQQVRGTLEALRSAGTEGRAAMLAPTSLLGLSAEDRAEIVEDEGWTLGIL